MTAGWAAAPATAAPARRHSTFGEVAAFVIAVGMVLIFSQGWVPVLLGHDEGPQTPLSRAIFLAPWAGALILLAMSPADNARTLLRQPFLVLLVWIAAASALWSIDPGETLRRTIGLFFTSLAGVVLAARFRWAALAEVFATAFVPLALGSFVAAALVPSFGTMHTLFPGAWQGLWSEKNALGGNMTIGLVLSVAAAVLNPKRAGYWAALAALCLFLVVMSTSKTSLVACLLGGCGFVLVALVNRSPAWRLFATWGALTSVVLLAMGLLVSADVFLSLLGKDATLTGRTKIWSAIMTLIPQRPWLGYGYQAVWSNDAPWTPLAWIVKLAGFRPGHAHNSWLEQWLGMGLVGLAAWAGYFLQTWTQAIVALYRHRGAYLAVPFLLIYTLISLTESIALVFNDMRWVLFVAIAAKLAYADPPPARPAMRRAPSPTVTTSAPPSRAWSTSRPSASGVQPNADGSGRTSWV